MGVPRSAQALAVRAGQPQGVGSEPYLNGASQDALVLSLSKEHPRMPGRTAILFAIAALRSVPHRWRHLRQAGSQFRGRSRGFVEYPG
jgi:hypothetical protein